MKSNYLKRLCLILLVVSIVFSFSCNKDENKIKITGNVNDPQLNQAVTGAYVSVSSSKITGGVYNPNYVEVTSTTTDAAGNFEMEIDIEKVGGYKLFFNKDQYFENEVEIATDVMEANDTYTGTYNLYPEAHISLHVKSTQFYYDKIQYHFSKGALQCSQCCSADWIQGIGYSYDEVTNCRVHGNSTVEINYLLSKGTGSPTSITDTVYCEAFKTINHDIKY